MEEITIGQKKVRAVLAPISILVGVIIFPNTVALFHTQRLMAPMRVLQREVETKAVTGHPSDMVGTEIFLSGVSNDFR